MKIFTRLFLTLLIAGAFLQAQGTQNPQILIQTELGEITIEIFTKDAPVTAGNFLNYVDDSLFKDATFYRIVTMGNQPNNDIKIEVIQGGLGYTKEPKTLPPIGHETTEKTGIMHKDGVISMARLNPGTASSEFFICVGDQPELNFGGKRNPDGQGFAAFGRVIAGMDVVREIHRQPAEGQYLNPRIKIHTIVRIK